MLPCCGRELEGAGRHGLELVASLGAWEGMPPTPEPSRFSPAEQKVRVLQARGQPGQGGAVALSYEDCSRSREEVERPGRRSSTGGDSKQPSMWPRESGSGVQSLLQAVWPLVNCITSPFR